MAFHDHNIQVQVLTKCDLVDDEKVLHDILESDPAHLMAECQVSLGQRDLRHRLLNVSSIDVILLFVLFMPIFLLLESSLSSSLRRSCHPGTGDLMKLCAHWYVSILSNSQTLFFNVPNMMIVQRNFSHSFRYYQLEDYSLVSFVPLNIDDESSIGTWLFSSGES